MDTRNLACMKVVPPEDWQYTAASTACDYHLLGLCLFPSLPPLNSGIHSLCLVPVNRFCCSSKFKTEKEINKDTHAHRAVWFASQQEQTDLLSTHYEGSARKYANNKNHFSFIITKKQHLSLYTLQTTGKGNRCTIAAQRQGPMTEHRNIFWWQNRETSGPLIPEPSILPFKKIKYVFYPLQNTQWKTSQKQQQTHDKNKPDRLCSGWKSSIKQDYFLHIKQKVSFARKQKCFWGWRFGDLKMWIH